MVKPLIMQWQLSSYFGWGVYGLNLALQWVQDPDLRPIYAVEPSGLTLDPLRMRLLGPSLTASESFRKQLASMAGQTIKVDAPVLHSLGGDFAPGEAGGRLVGSSAIGLVFFESDTLSPEQRANLARYDVVVAGSGWNAEVLKAHGVGPVVTVIQGVDVTLFHPAPTLLRDKNRFLIFSGGKLEYRKGQDIVLRAFRIFAARHPEARLVTAWHSPWPGLSRTFAAAPGVPEVPVTADNRIDAVGWAAAHGIDPGQVIDLGPIPNAFLPPILREMDAALFPNRAEGGTNLVAMECMACGVPTILSRNTGHRDLIGDGACLPLDRQSPVPHPWAGGWGESDAEEAAEALEALWRDRAAAAAMGLRGAERLRGLSWQDQAGALKAALRPYL